MENRMSDNQRRFFCRLLFLFFCCLPTAIIVYRAFHPRTPDDWQKQVLATIGVHTQVSSVETLNPDETVLRDVTVFDGHGQPVLSAMEVDLTFAPGRSQIVIRDQVRLSNHGLRYISETINRRLMRSDGCSVLLNDVVLTATEGGQTRELRVSPLEINTNPTAEGARAVITLQMRNANAFSDQRAVVQCNIDHIAATDQLRIHVETNQVAMPCWLVDQWLPELRELGAESGFAGRFFVEPKEDRLHGWIDGQFTDVNLTSAYGASTNVVSAAAITDANMMGQIKLHMSFPVLPRGVGADRKNDFAILKMPDGTTQPILPDYELQEVFNIASAIGKTVRTAKSKSAINF